jgi:hypothetical protein
VEGNEDRKFAIATETMDGINVAEISVAGNLDRETTEYYTLTVRLMIELFDNFKVQYSRRSEILSSRRSSSSFKTLIKYYLISFVFG